LMVDGLWLMVNG